MIAPLTRETRRREASASRVLQLCRCAHPFCFQRLISFIILMHKLYMQVQAMIQSLPVDADHFILALETRGNCLLNGFSM